MDIYLLTDGLCEDPNTQTSLMQTQHTYLDELTKYGKVWFYYPVLKAFQENPETFVVFPYFFWLSPENNPWRAWLELYGRWIDISPYSSFCIVRIVKKRHNIFDVIDPTQIGKSWTGISEISHIQELCSIFKRIEVFLGSWKSIKSLNRNNVWSLCAKDKNELAHMINLLQYEVDQLWYNAYPMLFDNFSSSRNLLLSKKETTLLWWCVSSLLEALTFVWVNDWQFCSEIKSRLFDYTYKHQDFDNNILPVLEANQDTNQAFILFIKEPSRAARENLTNLEKKRSILFIDELVGKLLKTFKGKNVNIILLSDHQSNIWNKKTYSWATLYYYGNLLTESEKITNFSEKHQAKIVSQYSLVKAIQKHIIYYDNKNVK